MKQVVLKKIKMDFFSVSVKKTGGWEGSGEQAFPSQHKKNVHFCLGE